MGTRGNGLKIADSWYVNDPSNPTTLSANDVFSIYRDRKDRMWVGTFGEDLIWLNRLRTGDINSGTFFRKGWACGWFV